MNYPTDADEKNSVGDRSPRTVSPDKRKKTLKRNGWILVLVCLAVAVTSGSGLVTGAFMDTIAFLALVAAICCFVAAACTKTGE